MLRWFGIALAVPICLILIGFGLLQTRPGKYWLAGAIARAVSSPGFTVSIDGLHGLVPFRVRVERIAIADRHGVYLTLHHIGFEVAAGDLLSGRLHLRSLHIAEIDEARPSSTPSRPLIDYLHVPQLPVAFVLDRLTIARLVLAPPVLGERVMATVAGKAAVEGGTARATLDLHRTDGPAGSIAMQMALAGTSPALSLRVQATEPTGLLIDHWLGRTDRLPLNASLDGDGPLTNWHGRLSASAGARADLHADLALALGPETVVGLSGTAAAAPLLPADLAPVVGELATFSLHAELGERIALNRMTLGVAAGSIAASGSFDHSDGAVAAKLRADLPDLARLSGVLGTRLDGAAILSIAVTGTQGRPAATVDLSATGIGASGSVAQRVEAHVSAAPTGPLNDPKSRIAVAAHGQIDGLAVRGAGALAQQLGREIDWSFAASANHDASAINIARFSAAGGGIDLAGSGRLATGGHGISGDAQLAGSAVGMRTGIAALDALIGGKARFAAAIRRDAAGAVALDRLALDSAVGELSGDGQFDPPSDRLAAALNLEVPQLKPLGAALGTPVSGTVSVRAQAQGALDHLRVASEIDGRGLAVAGAAVERVRLSGAVADLSRPKAVIDGSFSSSGLDGKIAVTAELNGASELVVPNLRLTAADTTIAGNLRVALANRLVEGSLTGRFPHLGRWSRLAGTPLAGTLDLSATLSAAGGGQGLDLTATGTGLAVGAGGSHAEVGGLAVTARLADLWRRPAGSGRLSLRAARVGAVDFATATAAFSTPRPGRFAFQAAADGHPLSLALAGEGGVAPGAAELRLTRLTGSLGKDRFALEEPLGLSRRGADLALDNLALQLGPGRISGSAAIRGEALSAAFDAANLPIAAGARLIGYPSLHGDLSLQARLGGTFRAPQARAVLSVSGLSPTVSSQMPRLGLSVAADWNGRIVGVQGRVTGLGADRVSFTGSLPMVLTRAPLGISLPPQGPLALRLQGGGDIGELADLLPLGEDRLSGRFAADVSVGGTLGSPAAYGQLKLTNARYANFASGAVLTNLNADVVGDRDRFRLASLSAGDGAGGKLQAQGGVVLRGPSGPSAELSATLANFRVAARDEAVATASGTVSVAGPLAAPRVVAALTIDRADITLPNSLPPSVVVLKVTEIGGKGGGGPKPPPASTTTALPMALDITVRMPGQVFVRGHGLTSDWHGRLKIAGTAEAPQVSGVLAASRGSVDLLGKSFILTRGTITFDGSAKLDPALDIVAEASAADITARVIISGYASAPKITLASTPPVPQDEILSRILFGQGVGQITAGQGLQLAEAAATLAGGGPGTLDRLRGKLGLDWLGFGQGPAGAASPILNPSVVSPATSNATAVSAGKYVAPGVSVGVTQGVSPPTSKVTVEIDVGHHVTVDTEAGQNGGTGIGLNYKYDY
jgi:translocation and assembly module TamB